MQYVYAKYGRDRAALAATLITYRPKSAVRDVGKALGLDLAQVDRLTRMFAWWDGRTVAPERIREAGFDPDHPLIRRLVALAGDLMGFPRHLSQHVGGFVIARGLLERMVPVENAAMADRTVIQWDKDDLDALGLLKVDCLALGMLSAIRRCLDLVSRWRGRALRMQDIPAEDPAVYAMIQRADTVGVFQIESRAQQSMLPRLKPANFYDLVIEVAIVRPGPIQGGMVHPYLRRRQGLEPVTYPSEAVEKVLSRTLGVPIFQEQVMQLAIVAAGFTPGEADQLRRSMAAWRRKGGLEKFEQRLVDGMAQRGYPRGVRAPDLPADPRLRRIRLSRIAFGLLRAARLHLVVAQALRAGGVHRGAAQLAADGLLRARTARRRRAAARRRRAPAGRDGERLGLHAGAPGRRQRRRMRPGRGSSARAHRPGPRRRARAHDRPGPRRPPPRAEARPADDRRAHGSRRAAHRPATRPFASVRRPRAPRRARSPRPGGARRRRRARPARRPSPRAPCGKSPASRSCPRCCRTRRSPTSIRRFPPPPKARTSSPTTAASA